MKKFLFSLVLLVAAATFWYCQKAPSEIAPENQLTESSAIVDRDGGGVALGCPIPNPPEDHSCNAQIRVRCIETPPGFPYSCFEVTGVWYYLSEGMVKFFTFTVADDNIPGNSPYQENVWYDIPRPLLKQSLLDLNCPGNPGNHIDAVVYTEDCYIGVAQWSMIVDIKSGGQMSSYILNGATGIMTPVEINDLPDPGIAFDHTDIDFLDNCTNTGAKKYNGLPFDCPVAGPDPDDGK